MSKSASSWRDLSEADVKRLGVPARLASAPKARQKYSAIPHVVLPDLGVLPAGECKAVAGGIRFASKREALRMVQLMLEKEAGAISHLELQPQYTLTVISPNGTRMIIGRYLADFRYQRHGHTIVEDAKGMKTAIYEWKKKHVQIEHGIAILET